MKNAKKMQAILDEFRNGANEFYRHSLVRNFAYSDGVKELAEEAGCYWLLDIIATECVPLLLKNDEPGASIIVIAENHSAVLVMEFTQDEVVWRREIDITDLPDIKFSLYLGNDGDRATLILYSEY